MREFDAIVQALRGARERGEAAALATVVATEGSSFRRPGARMLVLASGARTGCVSGGCLDLDVAEHALAVLMSGFAHTQCYEMPIDYDSPFGLDLGCGGAVRVLVAPLSEATAAVLAWRARATGGAIATIVAAVDPQIAAGTCWAVAADAPSQPPVWLTAALDLARPGLQRIEAGCGEIEVFVEIVAAPPRLLLVGASPVAAPLAAQMQGLGWDVAVWIPRGEVPAAIAALAGVAVTERIEMHRDYVVVMSHRVETDLAALRALLPHAPRYLGVLGSRARAEGIAKRLALESPTLDPMRLAGFHAPAGLDLGGEEPVTIALAIAAELVAVQAGRSGGSLRDGHGWLRGRPNAEDAQ